jgi:hypothetical protein
MSDRKGDPVKQPPGCDGGTSCPNMKNTYEGYESETWSCEVCGEHFKLYYEDMA